MEELGLDAWMARRGFLASLAVLGLPLADRNGPGAPDGPGAADGLGAGRRSMEAAVFPRNDLERVQRVVGASHGNFEVVRTLVTEQPALAKASWDWGFGDWETPLGAASHTGRREIAEFLIGHGARPTLFSAAMLGQVDVVRAYLTAEPALHGLHGPHGISLHRHALAGGAQAERVVDFLLERFGEDDAPVGHTGTDDDQARYGGRYRFDTDPITHLTVGVRNDFLLIGAGEQPTSRVLRVAPDVFHPTGAPAVRLRFDVLDGEARGLRVEDGPYMLSGRRVE